MKTLIALTLALFVSSNAEAAYYVAIKNASSISYWQPAHILVTGRGMELKTLFQLSANARSEKLRQLYPSHQIIWVMHDELENTAQRNLLVGMGFKILKHSGQVLSPALLLRELQGVGRIATLNIYSHTSAVYGAQLGGGNNRINPRDPAYGALASRFVRGAYAVLHGCNSGFYMAPWYAEKWGIPVMGSLTATDFERRHENGNFFRNEAAFKPAGSWATKGTQNYRMMPDNIPYNGMWGDYREGGLGFMKTFCPGGRLDQNCAQGMAESLLTFTTTAPVSSHTDRAALVAAVKEFMCPTGRQNVVRFLDCAKQIDRIVAGESVSETYSPFIGRALNCHFGDCLFKMDNCSPAAPGSQEVKCDLRNLSNRSTSWYDEVRAYLSGIELMSRKGIRLQ